MSILDTLILVGFPVEDLKLIDGKVATVIFSNEATADHQLQVEAYLDEHNLKYIKADSLPQPEADWTALIFAIAGNTDLKTAISQTTDQLALICLINEIKSPQPSFQLLKLHWDNTIAGLQQPLSTEHQQVFILLAEQKNLGISLNADCTLKQRIWTGQSWADAQ